MNTEIAPAIGLIVIGLILVITGLLHTIRVVNLRDAGAFQFLHNLLRRNISFFQFIWPLGTTPVFIVLILIIFISSWRSGLIVALVYTIATIVERAIKLRIKRSRPYATLPDVNMTQPKEPQDPSHPSGDSMRAWFLALVFPLAFGLSWPVYVFTIVLAIILSLGRVALGVHYPLDVIGGVGLGLTGTGVTVIIYNLAVIS